MVRVLLIFILLSSHSYGEEYDCSIPQVDNRGMGFCMRKEYNAHAGEMNSLLNQQLEHLTDEKFRDRLKYSQRAWEHYVESVCLYEAGANQNEAGRRWGRLKLRCEIEEIKKRIINLKQYVACRENGCW